MFFVVASNEMQEERNILRKELLRKRKPALGDLGNFHVIQIAKDASVGRFIVQKAYFGKKAKREPGKTLLTEEVRHMTHGSSQLSQQRPGVVTKRHGQVLTPPVPVKVTSYGNRDFVGVIKNLKVRSSWI